MCWSSTWTPEQVCSWVMIAPVLVRALPSCVCVYEVYVTGLVHFIMYRALLRAGPLINEDANRVNRLLCLLYVLSTDESEICAFVFN